MTSKSTFAKILDSRTTPKPEKDNKCKPIDNPVCAYRDCKNNSLHRLYFPQGFSALFCQKCARVLIKDKLASNIEVRV